MVVIGTWEPIVTNIYYYLSGGTNNSENPSSIGYNDSITLKDPTKIGYKFEGWYLDDVRVYTLTHHTEESITLVATWSTHVVSLSATDYQVNISGYEYVRIQLPVTNFANPCVINIAPSVTQVYISASKYTQYDLYINIQYRATDFDLHLENFAMRAPAVSSASGTNAFVGITMTTINKSALNLYTYGKVEIKGATPPNNTNGVGYAGSYAIKCSTLKILNAQELYIYGGDGSKGTTGQGYGAFAIYVDDSIYLPRNNVTILGGYSGNRDAMANRYNTGANIIYLDN